MDSADESFADANTYLPFKIVDTAVTKKIGEEFDAMPDFDGDEGKNYFLEKDYVINVVNSSLSAGRSID